jgi:hypothetical protein
LSFLVTTKTLETSFARTVFRTKILFSPSSTSRVLGTSFNLFAYDDEPVLRATLLSGSLEIVPVGGARDAVSRPGTGAS